MELHVSEHGISLYYGDGNEAYAPSNLDHNYPECDLYVRIDPEMPVKATSLLRAALLVLDTARNEEFMRGKA